MLDITVTFAVIVATVALWLAALGVAAAMVTKGRIVVEKGKKGLIL